MPEESGGVGLVIRGSMVVCALQGDVRHLPPRKRNLPMITFQPVYMYKWNPFIVDP